MTEYQRHMRQCNEFVQASPENFRRMLLFVVATIQQQLESVPAIIDSYQLLGEQSPNALGFKRQALPYIADNFERLYKQASKLPPQKHEAEQHLLYLFTQVPGIGLVKAGFAAQLYAGLVGCIDRHNVHLYGIRLSALRYDKALQERTLTQKRRDYAALCNGLGGSVFLWRQWCKYVARKRPSNWSDGLEVSIFHYECLTGKFNYSVPDLFDIEYEPRYNRVPIDRSTYL